MWPFDRKVSPAEAVLGLLTLTVAADGAVVAEEHARLGQILKRIEFSKAMSPEEFATLRVRVADALQTSSNPRAAIKRYAPYVPAEQRPAVYSLCLELVLADGRLDALEAAFLGYLRHELGIDAQTADRIQHALQRGELPF